MQSDTYGYILLVAAMTITDVAKVETMNGTIDGKAVNGTTAYNYKNGTIHYVATYAGESYNCTETYQTPLPMTYYQGSESDLEDLLDNWGNDDTYISTTCPQSFYDENSGTEPTSMHMTMTTNTTVTDNQSHQHTISILSEYSF